MSTVFFWVDAGKLAMIDRQIWICPRPFLFSANYVPTCVLLFFWYTSPPQWKEAQSFTFALEHKRQSPTEHRASSARVNGTRRQRGCWCAAPTFCHWGDTSWFACLSCMIEYSFLAREPSGGRCTRQTLLRHGNFIATATRSTKINCCWICYPRSFLFRGHSTAHGCPGKILSMINSKYWLLFKYKL